MNRLLAVILLAGGHTSLAAQENPQDAVSALENKFGVHAGKRRNHTKGLCFTAEFVAEPVASNYTISPIFKGEPVSVVGRFSHAGGNIAIKDDDANVLGMGLNFKLGQTEHKMAMLNLPYFAVPTPDAFIKNLQLSTPAANGKVDSQAFNQFKWSTPSIGHLQQALAGRKKNQQSYSEYYYNSIHTFYLTNSEGEKQAARWIFYPSGINQSPAIGAAQAASKDFSATLQQQMETGVVSFDMIVSFPDSTDLLTDPTYQWVTTGTRERFGRLTITDLNAQCESVNFDPNQVSKGFESSDDPVLKFRSGAYAISFAKRLSEQAK